MKAMVFAAGLGTRLKPLTDTMPKALVKVSGKPLIGYILGKLAASGYDDITVNVHHFPQQIREYLLREDLGARISISDESGMLLETGGALWKARPLLDGGSEPFLVHNVDILSNLDFAGFRSAFRPGALAVLAVSDRNTRRYLLFDADMRLVGWTDALTGEVRSPFPGLDPSTCRRYAFAGIHNISPAIFEVFDRLGFSGRFSIIDFYLRACAEYPVYGVVPDDFKMLDVGKAGSIEEAENNLSIFAV